MSENKAELKERLRIREDHSRRDKHKGQQY